MSSGPSSSVVTISSKRKRSVPLRNAREDASFYISKTSGGYSLVLFLLFVSAQCSTGEDELPPPYTILQGYNFPTGLLPKGVARYTLNRGTGEFRAHLNETCKFSVKSYKLEYRPAIVGVISSGRISNLSGVRVYFLLKWVNIVEVVRKGDHLRFSVGVASADFPLDNFKESPQCGCGLDCNGSSLVSSSSSAWSVISV